MSITGLPITKREVSHPATHSLNTGLLHPQERGEVSHLYPFSYPGCPHHGERGEVSHPAPNLLQNLCWEENLILFSPLLVPCDDI